MGNQDAILGEIISSCDILPINLGGLRSISRAADRLEKVRRTQQASDALQLLCTLISLVPDVGTAEELKIEALNILELGLIEKDISLILSLANLEAEHLPSGKLPNIALKTWVQQNTPCLSQQDSNNLLSKLLRNKAQGWWQQAVKYAISEKLQLPNKKWSKTALCWLGESFGAKILREIIPSSSKVEQCLLNEAINLELTKESFQLIKQESRHRQWSSLHALAAMKSLPFKDALLEQWTFPNIPYPGLGILVEHGPSDLVVREAIAKNDPSFNALVVQKTIQYPDMLNLLDASQSGWRALWQVHIVAGGDRWPPEVNKDIQCNVLIDGLLRGDEVEELIVELKEDLVDKMLQHTKWQGTWNILSVNGRNALERPLAEAIVKRCNNEQSVPPLDIHLANVVLGQARKFTPSGRLISLLLTWGVHLNEDEMIYWVSNLSGTEWKLFAPQIGQAVNDRSWERVAHKLFDLSKSRPEALPAAEACDGLLHWWDKISLTSLFSGNGNRQISEKDLARRLAEVGADLAHDCLDDIWERAGGKRQDLDAHGAPAVRWRTAAKLANQGNLKGGLLPLINELSKDFPGNRDLQDLKSLLIRS